MFGSVNIQVLPGHSSNSSETHLYQSSAQPPSVEDNSAPEAATTQNAQHRHHLLPHTSDPVAPRLAMLGFVGPSTVSPPGLHLGEWDVPQTGCATAITGSRKPRDKGVRDLGLLGV